MSQDQRSVRKLNDPAQVRNAERAERRREEEFLASLRGILKTPEGRRVMAELLARGGMDQTSFDNSGSVVYFREGKRAYALEIKAHVIAASEDHYELMAREFRESMKRLERGAEAIQTQAAGERE